MTEFRFHSGDPRRRPRAWKLDARTGGVVAALLVLAGTAMSTMRDELGAFDWECVESDGSVKFQSVGLKAGKGLGDLLEPEAWRENAVVLLSSSGGVGVRAMAPPRVGQAGEDPRRD